MPQESLAVTKPLNMTIHDSYTAYTAEQSVHVSEDPQDQPQAHSCHRTADFLWRCWVAVVSSTTLVARGERPTRTRTRAWWWIAPCGSTGLSFGATSFVEDSWRVITRTACQRTFKTISWSWWTCGFSHLGITIFPGLLACANVTT